MGRSWRGGVAIGLLVVAGGGSGAVDPYSMSVRPPHAWRVNGGLEQAREGIEVVFSICVDDPAPLDCPDEES